MEIHIESHSNPASPATLTSPTTKPKFVLFIKPNKKVFNDLERKIAELNAFGHTVAHDLKNPLSVINMSAYLLVKELANSDNAKVKKNIAFINNGIKHMINIIESILLLAGVNYIQNAIKYSDRPESEGKPIVKLGYDRAGTGSPAQSNHIRFWVQDNGAGIEQEKMGLLFKEFSRLYTAGHEGHGLGLSIVKSVIDKFGGSVGVESNVGVGSLFYFTLPTHLN